MRILLLRLSSMGDIVHTWPLAGALAASAPATELAWLVEEPFLPLVATHPAVTCAIPVATRRWRRRPLTISTLNEIRTAWAQVAAFAPDVIVDPQGLLKSALWCRAAPHARAVGLARSVRRERLAGLCYSETLAAPTGAEHAVDLAMSLLAAVGGEPFLGSVPDGTFLLRSVSGSAQRPADASVALVVGASARQKTWPLERFASLALGVKELGLHAVAVWGPGEEERARRVAAASRGAASVAPPTPLTELAAFLSQCRCVVGVDTGPVHLAASLGLPTVSIHLATDPVRNRPRGARVATVSSVRGRASRGRARVAAAGDVAPGDVLAAMQRLGVTDPMQAIE